MQKVGPGFQHVRKIIRAIIAEHPPELVAPGDALHYALFVEIHCPFAGSEHLVYGVEGRSFVLQFTVQSVMFLRLCYVDSYASILHQPAFRITGQYAHTAIPPDRAVLSAKAELMTRSAHDIFFKSAGVHIAKESIPVLSINTSLK